MISVEEAQAIIRAKIVGGESEVVPLAQAQGRILWETIGADLDSPPFDRSAMDGYAVRGIHEHYRVTGVISTGGDDPEPLAEGEARRIYTGGRVPSGATVVMQEEAWEDNGRLKLSAGAKLGWVRRQGEDFRQGAPLVESGERLGPVALAVLASVGVHQVTVARRPRVSHLATGNELVEVGAKPVGTQIRDSNSILIRSLVERSGGFLQGQRRLRDDRDLLRLTVKEFEAESDLLLISGGASVGDFDFSREILREAGYTLHFEQVNVRPGKPMVFATAGNRVAMVLPGNPVSHYVCFHLFVRWALAARSGEKMAAQRREGRVGKDFEYKPNARLTYWPMQWGEDGKVKPLRWESSGHLAALLQVDGFMRIPEKRGRFEAGERCEIELWEN
jgi:molybdopterin molybdotransferase